MDKITSEVTLLGKNKINTMEELDQKANEVNEKLEKLIRERRCLYNKVRRCRQLETKDMLQQDIETLSIEIKELRKEARLYDSIRERSLVMKEKLSTIHKEELEQSQSKKLHDRKLK